jgi:hypothetical protein
MNFKSLPLGLAMMGLTFAFTLGARGAEAPIKIGAIFSVTGPASNLGDPEKKTAEVLGKAGVPFRPVNNVDAIAGIDDGVLVIGEGVAWQDYRALAALAVKAADRGAAVLCLAPGRGEMTVPGMGEAESATRPSEIVVKEAAVIGELDKRLDWK